MFYRILRKKEEGYLTVETAVWVPAAAILLLLLVWLCSYLYQGCFLMQTAYLSAFRGCRAAEENLGLDAAARQEEAQRQLEGLMDWQVLSFGETDRQIEADLLRITVTLERETPLRQLTGDKLRLRAKETAFCRNPVIYIRGLRQLT